MAKICGGCNRKLGIMDGKVKVKDEVWFCNSCWERAGFNTWGDIMSGKPLVYTSKDIVNLINGIAIPDPTIDYGKMARYSHIVDFAATLDICAAAKFNDNAKKMLLSDNELIFDMSDSLIKSPESYTLFSYDQIVSFELLENGQSMASGGLGRAALGGILFGGVGAVVGASTRSYQGVCEELTIKITVKNYKDPAFYIRLIAIRANKASSEYKNKMQMAQDILSKLQLITDERKENQIIEKPANKDKFEEIKKYKELLNDGIISQKEFDAKKRELLGL